MDFPTLLWIFDWQAEAWCITTSGLVLKGCGFPCPPLSIWRTSRSLMYHYVENSANRMRISLPSFECFSDKPKPHVHYVEYSVFFKKDADFPTLLWIFEWQAEALFITMSRIVFFLKGCGFPYPPLNVFVTSRSFTYHYVEYSVFFRKDADFPTLLWIFEWQD